MKRKARNILGAGKTSDEKKDSDEGNRDREEINKKSQYPALGETEDKRQHYVYSYATAVKGGKIDYQIQNRSSVKSASMKKKTFKDESQDEGQNKVNNKYNTPPKTYANAVMADQPKNLRSQKHSYSKVTSDPSVKLEKLSYPSVLKGEYNNCNCECMFVYVCGSKCKKMSQLSRKCGNILILWQMALRNNFLCICLFALCNNSKMQET